MLGIIELLIVTDLLAACNMTYQLLHYIAYSYFIFKSNKTTTKYKSQANKRKNDGVQLKINLHFAFYISEKRNQFDGLMEMDFLFQIDANVIRSNKCYNLLNC